MINNEGDDPVKQNPMLNLVSFIEYFNFLENLPIF